MKKKISKKKEFQVFFRKVFHSLKVATELSIEIYCNIFNEKRKIIA
jgi:hypothetical protein